MVCKIKDGLTCSHTGILTTDHFHIANFTSPPRSTRTLIIILDLITRSSIFARISAAPIDIFTAILSGIPGGTVASVVGGMILTSSTVQTGWAIAQIDSVLTIRPGESGFAGAAIRIDAVDASTSVHAATSGTIFVVGLAVYAGKSKRAGASVGVDVLVACGAVLTRMGRAFVDVYFALFAFETIHTQAGVVPYVIEASSTILARICKENNWYWLLQSGIIEVRITETEGTYMMRNRQCWWNSLSPRNLLRIYSGKTRWCFYR